MANATPSPAAEADQALEQLAAATRDLSQAVEAGDAAAVRRAADARSIQIETLRRAASHHLLTAEQLRRLEEAIRQGDELMRLAAAWREAARASLAELAALRLRLAAWSPARPEAPRDFDLSA